MDFTFELLQLHGDTGGAGRTVDVHVMVDSRQDRDERLHSAFYEILSAYIDPHEDRREFVLEMADTLMEGLRAVEANG